MIGARALRRPKRRQAGPLELDVLLEALSQAFLCAQARLEARQREQVVGLAGLALRVELDGRSELVPMSELVPARQHRIHELKIEFECTSAYVRVGTVQRLGLRLRGGRSGRPMHRACLILSDGSPARAELRIDGEHVRCVSLAGAVEREGPRPVATTHTRPDLLLVAPRDAARVAAILSPSRSSTRTRPRRSRSAAASRHRAPR